MGLPTLARRNRVRAINSDPVGIEYQTRRGAGYAPAPGAVQETRTPKIDNERGYTYPFAVTNQPQLLLPADLNRKFLHLVNNDVLGNVTVSIGRPLSYGQGIKAGASGGGFLFDNNTPTAAIYIVGDIANNPNISYTVG